MNKLIFYFGFHDTVWYTFSDLKVSDPFFDNITPFYQWTNLLT